MAQHTPGPMQYGHYFGGDLWIGPDYDQEPIARVKWDTDGAREEARANAAEIVKRWNAHEDLVAALKLVQDDVRGKTQSCGIVPNTTMHVIYRALAKVEGK